MKKNLRICLLLRAAFLIILLKLTQFTSYAQDKVRVDIKVVSVGSFGYSSEGRGASRYRFNVNGVNVHPTKNCYHAGINGEYAINSFLTSQEIDLNNSFQLEIISHNERKDESDDCSAQETSDYSLEKKDIFEQAGYFTVSPRNYRPGEYYDEKIYIRWSTTTYTWVNLRIKYSIPIPLAPSIDQIGNICATTLSTLTTEVPVPNGSPVPSFSYIWEYLLNGTSTWKSLSTTTTPSVSFYPYNLKTITASTTIQFRVKVKTKDAESGFSSISTFTFIPAAPSFYENYGGLVITPSCLRRKTGIIDITNLSFSTRYKYILRKDWNNASGCDPEEWGDCLGDRSGEGNYRRLYINELDSGKYTLLLSNAGGDEGVCYNSYNITIPAYDPIKINATAVQISCPGAKDGKIYHDRSGGSPSATWTIKHIEKDSVINRGDWILSNLPPGSYAFTVTDACSTDQLVVVIDNPTKVKCTIITSPSPCFNPSMGNLTVTATQGSGRFNYILAKAMDNSEYARLENGGPNAFNFSTLPPDNYRLSIRDSQRPTCSGFDTTFTIAPTAAIELDSLSSTNATCPGSNSGTLTIKGKGGVGAFEYSIVRTEGNLTLNSKDGKFEELFAGEYTIIINSSVPGCLDRYTHSEKVTIKQPDSVTFAYETFAAACHGDPTGGITTSAVGGTGEYSYSWEILMNGNWNGLAFKTKDIDSIPAGEYRLKVMDFAGCSFYSPKMEVFEPQKLEVTKVLPIRNGCTGAAVTFNSRATGGVAPYQFEYSLNSNEFIAFDSTTVLGLGSYQIRAVDKNGCVAVFPDPFEISDNALLLSSKTFPNCYKSSNGRIVLQALGGEEPYSYSKDNGKTFQSSNEFLGLEAGTYKIVIKDHRGCENTLQATVDQKQDTPEMNFLVSSSQNALDTLIIAEISNPKPDSVFWEFDNAAKILDANPSAPKIKFDDEGSYTVTMFGYFDGCEYAITKTLTLNPFDPNVPAGKLPGSRPIDKFLVSPNPNDGKFTLSVTLLKKQQVVMVVYDVNGIEQLRKRWDPLIELSENIDLGKVVAGPFIIRVLTDNDAREAKIIVQK